MPGGLCVLTGISGFGTFPEMTPVGPVFVSFNRSVTVRFGPLLFLLPEFIDYLWGKKVKVTSVPRKIVRNKRISRGSVRGGKIAGFGKVFEKVFGGIETVGFRVVGRPIRNSVAVEAQIRRIHDLEIRAGRESRHRTCRVDRFRLRIYFRPLRLVIY